MQPGCPHGSRVQCPVPVQDARGGEDAAITFSLPGVLSGHGEREEHCATGGARLALPANTFSWGTAPCSLHRMNPRSWLVVTHMEHSYPQTACLLSSATKATSGRNIPCEGLNNLACTTESNGTLSPTASHSYPQQTHMHICRHCPAPRPPPTSTSGSPASRHLLNLVKQGSNMYGVYTSIASCPSTSGSSFFPRIHTFHPVLHIQMFPNTFMPLVKQSSHPGGYCGFSSTGTVNAQCRTPASGGNWRQSGAQQWKKPKPKPKAVSGSCWGA